MTEVAPHSDGRDGSHKWRVLATVGIGVFMATLDSSIVNVSLPVIAHHFGAALSGAVAWVVIAYLVVVAALLLTSGRVADLVGKRPVWTLGLCVFTLGSGLCGAAGSLGMLVGARAVQGVGGAMMLALSGALLVDAFPRAELGRALGWNAVIVGVGIGLGPSLGGIITDHLSWRWIFFVNLPVGALGIVASLRALPRGLGHDLDPGVVADSPHRREGLDLLGAALLAMGLAALTLGASFGPAWGWGSPRIVASFAVAAVALALLAPTERRARDPILAPALFRNRAFFIAAAGQTLAFFGLFAVAFLLPFYLIELRGFDPEKAGLLLTPLPLSLAAVGPVAGTLADRLGRHEGGRWLRPLGLLVAGIGLWLIAHLERDASTGRMALALLLAGGGQALFFPPNNAILLGAAPSERRGVASGLLATGRAIGQSLSVALSGALFSALGGSAASRALDTGGLSPARRAALEGTFLHAYRVGLLACAAVLLATLLVSLLPLDGQRDARRSA